MADQIIDLHALDEDRRIDLMAAEIRKGLRISFIVETHAKADRYARKLKGKAPGAIEVERHRFGPGIMVIMQRGAVMGKPKLWRIPFRAVIRAEAVVEAETKTEAIRKFRACEWEEQSDGDWSTATKIGPCVAEDDISGEG